MAVVQFVYGALFIIHSFTHAYIYPKTIYKLNYALAEHKRRAFISSRSVSASDVLT